MKYAVRGKGGQSAQTVKGCSRRSLERNLRSTRKLWRPAREDFLNKVIFTANWDWVLYNFRRSLARALENEGYDVVFVCPRGKYVDDLLSGMEARWVEWPLDRRSVNPFRELRVILLLAQIYRREEPDIIHHDTIKPNVYGALATVLNHIWSGSYEAPAVVSTFMGVGFLFSDRMGARLLRPFVLPIMRFALQQEHVTTVFSNRRDRERFVELGLIEPDTSRVMVSEFVDTNRYFPRDATMGQSELAAHEMVVLMAARMLWDKGVNEFVKAAGILESRGSPVRMCLAGAPDEAAPGYVPAAQLQEWNRDGLIEWLGHREDMPELLRNVDVAVLPTHYNEGLPRFLVEAASSGLPLIASNIPACRRIVRDGENGFLIPSNDPKALADAIEVLANDLSLRNEMGESSRGVVEQEFAEASATKEWMRLYEALV